MVASPERYFPENYRDGRSAFIEACEDGGLGVTARVHPKEQGADAKPLFMDVATIGPRDARKALLLISGTHGVEGYFGSGVQTGLLREGLAARVPEGAKIVLLHALNPYGFSWDRRVNEDNADVNRNFVNHKHPPRNEAYAALADAIAPRDISREAMKMANAKLRDYSDLHGAFALQEAISKGQYHHPDGVYFGGSRESWSAAMLKDVFGEEQFVELDKLLVIDFHTGLGESGAAEMITEDVPGTPAYARARKIWGDRVASSEAGESLSAPLTGTIDKRVSEWMERTELTFAALEVGTEPVREVFNALRKDNWLHAFGGLERPERTAIKKEMRAAFYPDAPQWKKSVWRHATEVVDAALKAIA
ncbi:MAG: DUF2817 domain-containing protein [Proteobacteria bacterium]|nr:DUF2817 domain-containing protein [Pseudomonadota bacterium]